MSQKTSSLPGALAQVDVALASATAASFTYPTVLYQLLFCGDERRYLFQEELSLVSNLSYEVRQRIVVETPLDEFRVTFMDGNAAISSINEILDYRRRNLLARVDPIPDLGPPPGDDTPTDPGNETELFTTGGEQDLQISYYLYDHLGNTRIVFHTVLENKTKVDDRIVGVRPLRPKRVVLSRPPGFDLNETRRSG